MRVPPHNIDAEKSVLGGLMLDSESWDEIAHLISENDFYKPFHQIIFRAIKDLQQKNEACDLLMVNNKLTESGDIEKMADGTSYIAEVVDQTPSSANIESYARIIREKSLLRKFIQTSGILTQEAYEQDFESLSAFLDRCEQRIFQLTDQQKEQGLVKSNDVIKSTMDYINDLAGRQGEITGVGTGFIEIDRMTAGFQKGELTIIAARPSMGKTALSLNMALYAALNKCSVAYFSVEMGSQTLMSRLLSIKSLVGLGDIRLGKIKDKDWAKIINSAAALSETSLFIDESSPVSPFEIRSKARRLKAKHGLDIIFVDYLQLMGMKQKTESREREVSEISKMLKSIAKELQVPVVALSQLNRGVEGRSDRRPMLSDLRESGSIEQDADVIMMLYREDYYDRENIDVKGLAEVIIGKQRNGPTGTVKLRWQPQYGIFANNITTGPRPPSPTDPSLSPPHYT